MAIAYRAGTSKTIATDTVVTDAITSLGLSTALDQLIVVGVACDMGATVAFNKPIISDNYNGATYTEVIADGYVSGSVRCRMFYKTAAKISEGTTASLKITATGVGIYASVFVMVFSGAHLTSPVETPSGAGASGTTTVQPGSITPSQANEVIVSLVGLNGASTSIGINSSFLEAVDVPEISFASGSNYGGQMAYLIQTTAAAVNPTWTRNSANGMVAMQVAFRQAGTSSSLVATINGLSRANTASVNGLGIGNVATVNGLA